MLLVKIPVPVPSEVLLFAIVGVCDVLQQTPRAVIGEPPLLEMLPPDTADVLVTIEGIVVANSGSLA